MVWFEYAQTLDPYGDDPNVPEELSWSVYPNPSDGTNFQVKFADEDLGLQENENDFLHTENVMLIDAGGRIRGIYRGTYPAEVEKLVKEIGILEKE
jgi:cytochrome oxidase Cu insertion factor (SCO1/SenC/PrrC family)